MPKYASREVTPSSQPLRRKEWFMLRFILLIARLSGLSLLVLILGNALHWRGKTISDQVRTQMSHAERSETFESLQNWAQTLSTDAKKGFLKKNHFSKPNEDPHSSETPKIKALIQKLHSFTD
jgi:hypothetical protein